MSINVDIVKISSGYERHQMSFWSDGGNMNSSFQLLAF